MVTRFGSREICDVTFKALTNGLVVGNHTFSAGQPVFIIDTATTSSMEQATTTVYAQGGKGYNRLMSWEGEKTMTFNVTDALMSPLGLKVLTGAGFADASASAPQHIHTTINAQANATGVVEVSLATLVNELGLPGNTSKVVICKDDNIKAYATVLDKNGAIIDWIDNVVIVTPNVDANTKAKFQLGESPEAANANANALVKLDFYVVMKDNSSKITIKPEDFGGYFYVEADTLYRNQDGKDMAATLTFPKVKIQSGFTITMAANGDPSTFDFVMDAFPATTWFDPTTKVVCDITIVGGATDSNSSVTHVVTHNDATETKKSTV